MVLKRRQRLNELKINSPNRQAIQSECFEDVGNKDHRQRDRHNRLFAVVTHPLTHLKIDDSWSYSSPKNAHSRFILIFTQNSSTDSKPTQFTNFLVWYFFQLSLELFCKTNKAKIPVTHTNMTFLHPFPDKLYMCILLETTMALTAVLWNLPQTPQKQLTYFTQPPCQ